MIVRNLRNKRNWSQEHLATMCGLSIRTIQRVESGQSASLETLKSLASVFDIDISKLTEEIKVIDKKSEHWKAQALWFRMWAWGFGSRKAQIWIELLILTSAVILSMASLFDLAHTGRIALFLMFILYLHAVCIRYGDNNQAWGYTT